MQGTKTPTVQPKPFELRQWREAWTHTDDDGSQRSGPALFAIYDVASGVRMAYAKSEESGRAACAKWNEGKIPEAIERKADSARYLKKLLRPGDKLQTILRHRSRSGMQRRISVTFKGQDITWHSANVLDEKIKGRAGWVQDAGITVNGCGMDMGFSLVYNLSAVLFPDGFECIGDEHKDDHGNRIYCPANDHANGDRNKKPHMHPNAGGYALRQEWL